MSESNRLSESTKWIDLGFVERERTPREIIEKVFAITSQVYHSRIQLFFSRSRVSSGVVSPFTTGFRKPITSQLTVRVRITLRLTKL